MRTIGLIAIFYVVFRSRIEVKLALTNDRLQRILVGMPFLHSAQWHCRMETIFAFFSL